MKYELPTSARDDGHVMSNARSLVHAYSALHGLHGLHGRSHVSSLRSLTGLTYGNMRTIR